MIVRLLKWAAVFYLPKILQQTDKPANAMLEEYREAAAKVLGECADTSKEMATESAAVSAEMAKLEAIKILVKNNESLRLLCLLAVGIPLCAGILIGAMTATVLGALAGIAGLLEGQQIGIIVGGGVILGFGGPVIAWLFFLRKGAWQAHILNAVKKVRYGDDKKS